MGALAGQLGQVTARRLIRSPERAPQRQVFTIISTSRRPSAEGVSA